MKNILLVEDEENLVQIVGSVLEEEGYHVQRSTSAEEALKLLPNYRPDLIISDLKMGEMDGFEMIEQIRKETPTKQIPFIYVTSFDDADSARKAKNLGATAYITKPFDLDELLRVIRSALNPS
ncbi:MAG TPA: response regulator [Bacteroidota bacterium]|nr:response regulator [Bacteroidota bacterium]